MKTISGIVDIVLFYLVATILALLVVSVLFKWWRGTYLAPLSLGRGGGILLMLWATWGLASL
jgi:hypothetical protein